jgi:hypothetical protein
MELRARRSAAQRLATSAVLREAARFCDTVDEYAYYLDVDPILIRTRFGMLSQEERDELTRFSYEAKSKEWQRFRYKTEGRVQGARLADLIGNGDAVARIGVQRRCLR